MKAPWLVLQVTLGLAAGCTEGAATIDIPLPDLGGLEPRAAERLRVAADRVRSAPEDPEAWRDLGLTYEANDFLDLARASYELAIERRLDARTFYRLGIVASRRGDPAAAVGAFRRSVELVEGYAPAWWRLGSHLLDQGEVDRAEEAFRRARELDPRHLGGWTGLARVALERGDAEGAIVILDRALELKPGAPLVGKLLRSAYFEAGRIEEARALHVPWNRPGQMGKDPWQRELLALREKLPMERAVELFTEGQFREAAQLMDAFTRENPGDPNAFAYLASARLELGERERARRTLEQALEQAPESIVLLRVLVRCDVADGDTEGAIDVLERILAIDSLDLRAWRRKGKLEGRLGRHARAIESLQRVARFDERDPELLLAIGEHQLALERWEDARASFERALSLEEGSRARAGLRRALDALAPRAATGEDAGKSDG